MTTPLLPTTAQFPLISTQGLEAFWVKELDLFALPNPVPERLARRLARLARSERIIDHGSTYEPNTITTYVNRVMRLEKERRNSDPLSDEGLSAAATLEQQATHAGLYWLAVTGVLPGRVGINDGIGAWFFEEAALCAAPSDRKAYQTLATQFSSVRNFIEYTCYHKKHPLLYVNGPQH